MIRSKRAMGFLWVALTLLIHAWTYVPVAKGQGTRKGDLVFNSRGVPLAGATIRVCAMPASGQPCALLAPIYSDPGLTHAFANPTMTDELGNYFFYAAPGKYEIETSGPGIITKQLSNVILPSDPSSATFTAPQKFDADVHAKGPNPVFDIMRYGAYVANGQSPQTMTCSINSGSTILSCASNPDFQNGHGVVIPFAGPLPLSLPAAPGVAQVTPTGLLNGSTSYSYQFVLEDYNGGLTAAGAGGSTTTGAATLGVNTVAVTGVTRTGGVDTFICASKCNIGAGSQVQISGFTGGTNSTINGTVVVNSTPTNTTFTVLASGFNDYSETASAIASVRACNNVFPAGTLAVESVILRSWIYRNGTLVGVSPGQDPFFIDCGQGVTAPSYVPTSAPTSQTAEYLATTIVGGGGTNTMTLATAVSRTVSKQTVQHDNGPTLKAAWTAALSAHGGTVLIPVIPSNSFLFFPFNSTVDFSSISNPTNSTVKLIVSNVGLSQPWVLAPFSQIEGIPQTSTAFQYTPLGAVGGTAHPLFLANHNTAGGVRISGLKFGTAATGQSSLVLDQKVTGGGEVGFIFEDNGYSGNAASAVVIKGGFDFWFERGVCGLSGFKGTGWYAPGCVSLTNASTYVGAGSGTQAPGRVKFRNFTFIGATAIQIDNFPISNQSGTWTSGGGNIFLDGVLHEANAGPTLRVAYLNGAFNAGFTLSDVAEADQTNGLHQPIFEATGSTNINNIILTNNKGDGAQPMMLGGSSISAPLCINNVFVQGCGSTPFQNITGSRSTVDGGIVGAQNGGSIGYLLPAPAAPASCIVSAGGGVPVGSLTYFLSAADRSPVGFKPYQGLTPLGPGCNVTTTSGNQTVTITRPLLPVGATGWLVWRAGTGTGTGAEAAMPASCGTPIPASTNTYVDTFSFVCGTSAPTTNTAFVAGINSSGITAGTININGEALTASPRAEQTIFLPGALTTAWTGSTWTLDRALTVTRVQAQAKTAPAGCATNAIVRVTDGSALVNVTVSAAANDSGAIAQNYPAGASLTVSVQTAASGCTTSPADVNVIVQYKMQ